MFRHVYFCFYKYIVIIHRQIAVFTKADDQHEITPSFQNSALTTQRLPGPLPPLTASSQRCRPAVEQNFAISAVSADSGRTRARNAKTINFQILRRNRQFASYITGLT